jgi:hypothetical protein
MRSEWWDIFFQGIKYGGLISREERAKTVTVKDGPKEQLLHAGITYVL